MARCKYCTKPKASFRAGLSSFCNIDCAVAYAQGKAPEVRAKMERQRGKEKLAVLNQTITHWRPKAQSAFNRFIRLRDHNLPCISCDRSEMEIRRNYAGTGGMWDCGHYLSCGARGELRFSEDNAHKQCKQCNRDKSGNAGQYRINLIRRIGEHRVRVLEEPGMFVDMYIFMYIFRACQSIPYDEQDAKIEELKALLDPPRWRWYDYEAVYNWYNKLANKMAKEL